MKILEYPAPTYRADPPDLAARALIEEARRHRRRRWLFDLFVLVVVVSLGVGAIVFIVGGGPGRVVHRVSPFHHLTTAAGSQQTSSGLSRADGPPVVAFGVVGSDQPWVLDGSGLFLGTTDASLWRTVDPPGGTDDPIAVMAGPTFINASDGWVMLHYGLPFHGPPTEFVFRTVDGGKTWTRAVLSTFPQGFGQATMGFLNPSVGWIVTTIGSAIGPPAMLWVTVDGGVNWRLADGDAPVTSAVFTSPTDVWGVALAGQGGVLEHSTDAGLRWAPVAVPIPPAMRASQGRGVGLAFGLPTFFGDSGVLAIHVLGSRNGLVLDVTHDGGLSWTSSVAPFGGGVPSLLAPPPFDAIGPTKWVFWTGSDFYSTDDGGVQWSAVEPNITLARRDLYPGTGATPMLSFQSLSDGWIVVAPTPTGRFFRTALLHTRDGGRTFSASEPPGPGIPSPGYVFPGIPLTRRTRP